MTSPHPIRFQPPYYRRPAPGASLQRYGDAEFISRFQQDVRRGVLEDPQAHEWRDGERRSDHDDALVLRLPLHRTFYVVSAELACDQLGSPPVDPARIASAGFVIRRIGGQTEQGWMLAQGDAIGWQQVSLERRDPDVNRRLCRNGMIRRVSEPAYSGEQTHPLHVLHTADSQGRKHTLLFGYVALGGFYYHRDTRGLIDQATRDDIRADSSQLVSWPFAVLSPQPGWSNEHATQVHFGRPTLAFYQLMRLLVMRERLGAADSPQNAELADIAGRVHFYRTPVDYLPSDGFSMKERETVRTARDFSLLDYLTDCAAAPAGDPLFDWIRRQEPIVRAHPGNPRPPLERLPAKPPADGTLYHSLFLSAADAEEMRTALDMRTLDRIADQARELPIPKFQQRPVDLFAIVPFARIRDDAGEEQLIWADADRRSEPFRVAGPLDAEAARPSLIQMPSLKDAKKGLAQGMALATPPDTMNLMNAIDTSEGVSADMVPDTVPSQLGMQWLCSFSIPIVTICAIILLLIIVSLLDYVLRWMPFFHVCAPMPDIGGGNSAAENE